MCVCVCVCMRVFAYVREFLGDVDAVLVECVCMCVMACVRVCLCV